MITIDNLSFGYNRKKNVFENFSLTFKSGAIYGLLGKNGTGKSTLLYLIAGLLRPQKGMVLFEGQNVNDLRPSFLQDIFLVPEEFSLPNLTIKEYVKLNAEFYPNFDYNLLVRCLAVFEMDDEIKLKELSMGQKKKVFISFALSTNTRLLIMDEPTNGMDIPSKSQFRKAVTISMMEEKCIIISTHQVKDVDTLLDHIVVIDQSDVLLNASTEEIGRKLRFEEVAATQEVPEALFEQKTLQGKSVILKNEESADTPINLEMLFVSILENPELYGIMFKK